MSVDKAQIPTTAVMCIQCCIHVDYVFINVEEDPLSGDYMNSYMNIYIFQTKNSGQDKGRELHRSPNY